MPLIRLENIYKSFGTDHLFDDLELKIYRKEKVGLIGSNGSGKTTIFRMILGQESPDAGHIIKREGISIGYLPQEPYFDGEKTVIEEMHSNLAHLFELQDKVESLARQMETLKGEKLESVMSQYEELSIHFELAGGYDYETRIKLILAGVGIDEEFYNVKTSALSGGQLSRLGLARVLMGGCDLLLLDEPTNHLDLAATEWLERFLRNYPGAAVMISHDRYMLDKVVVKIFELTERRAMVWKGNYSAYLKQRENYILGQERELESRKKMLAKEQDFIERNRNDVGMRKVARGRAKRLERILDNNPDYLKKTAASRGLSFNFGDVNTLSYNVLKCRSLSKRFDDIVLFDNLEFDITTGQRLAITGPNGTGKTTLLKIALGKEPPTTGKIKFGPNLVVGYMDQRGEELNKENSALNEILENYPDLTPQQARAKLGGFMFYGDDVFKKVENLSGGEQNRLMLCKLVLKNPDVLILDEPTNHLDIAGKEALEAALQEFKGAILVVSHDRYFIDRIAEKMLIIGVDEFGKRRMGSYEFVEGFESVYTVYSRLIAERSEKALQKKYAAVNHTAGLEPGRKLHKERKAAPEDIKQFNKYRIEQIEEMIMDTEEGIEQTKAKFGLEEYYKDHTKMQSLQNEVKDKEKHLELLYKAYEWKVDS
jgi:ATP-binding cassette, subfamily F, member 3